MDHGFSCSRKLGRKPPPRSRGGANGRWIQLITNEIGASRIVVINWHRKCQYKFDTFCARNYSLTMTETEQAKTGQRERNKEAIRTRIEDAIIALMSEGGAVNHDNVAERTGIGRRTVYRYYPDQEALMQAAWNRVTALAGPSVTFPKSEADLTSTLKNIYEGFDRIAPLATIVRSTPQGRAVRLSWREKRQQSYLAATAEAVKNLPKEDQILATAMLQVLHTMPWLEMRDQWGLNGTQCARACGWAIRTLLKDLK